MPLTSKLLRTYYRVAASKPTSSLSMDTDNLHPLTLNMYLGTLTHVWVVPLSRHRLTPRRRLLESTRPKHSELDKKPRDCSPCISNPYLYRLGALVEGLTTVNFGRNQLLPASIGFSPLFPCYKNACTQHLFGPPRHVTAASPYTGIDRPVSGRIRMTAGTFIPRPS